jgi:hypothetical protein
MTLAALPLAGALRRQPTDKSLATPGTSAAGSARLSAHRSVDRNYLLLHAGFFTCGFHIAFLVTHLPGEVSLCGLPADVASGRSP